MRKLKEFFVLFILFVFFTILPIILFVCNNSDSPAFLSNSHYLKLFLNDGIFWRYLINTYVVTLLYSLLAVSIYCLLCHFVKFFKKRKLFYCGSMLLSGIVAGIHLFGWKTNFFGLPMGVYDPGYLVSNTPPKASVSVFEILIALQIGSLVGLLVWCIEKIFNFIKNKAKSKGKL